MNPKVKGDTKIIPNPPTKMVFIALMILPHKQFGDMTRELIREKMDMVSHARHHVYTRTKKERRMCRCLPPSLLRDTLSSRVVGRDRLL